MSEHKVTLGHLLNDEATRDAVHVAIAPVTAHEAVLHPGQHVAVEHGRAWVPPVNRPDIKLVGVVDPFLRAPVNKGESCYVLLYPGEAQKLRHHWEHPSFPDTLVPAYEETSYDGCPRSCD